MSQSMQVLEKFWQSVKEISCIQETMQTLWISAPNTICSPSPLVEDIIKETVRSSNRDYNTRMNRKLNEYIQE